MAVKKTNVEKTDQVAWTYRAKIGEDTLTASIAYVDDFLNWEERCPDLGDAHPDYAAFKLVEITASRLEGEQIEVTLNYELNAHAGDYPGRPDNEAPTARYSIRTAGGDEHILTSPFAKTIADEADDAELEYKALYQISNGQELDEEGNPWADSVTSVPGLAILEKIRRGNIAYRAKGLAYIERKLITNLNDVEFNKLKQIDENVPGDPGGNAKGWLYDDATAEPAADGASWTLERIWLYSPDGWDEDLYTPPSP